MNNSDNNNNYKVLAEFKPLMRIFRF